VIAPHIVSLGDSGLNVEFENVIDPGVNARAIGLAERLQAARLPGLRDVVPTYRTVTLHFDPLHADIERILAAIEEFVHAEAEPSSKRPTVIVPVRYGGEYGVDLGAVAAFAGIPEEEVIRLHSERVYRVYMLGFTPGYPYMGIVDPRIGPPRHATPRVQIPAGSVGVAGPQTSINPIAAPGGWHIIGRTPTRVFDLARDEPFLLKPGDTVKFEPADTFDAPPTTPPPARADAAYEHGAVRILQAGMLTTVQDLGRWGSQHLGVSVSGAMDLGSHRLVNRLLNNPDSAASFEITLLGPELQFESDAWFAVTGAEFDLHLDKATVPMNAVWHAKKGSRLRFGPRRRGARAYLGVAGGFDVSPVLGSRATHIASAIGGLDGRALTAGVRVPIGKPPERTPKLYTFRRPLVDLPDGGAALRVLIGPQSDYFTEQAVKTLLESRYQITPDSNRMGFRLRGPVLEHARGADIISDATPLGGIQVPASGDPILLMADRQTTGGYPKIGVTITADLLLAAQLAPGDWITFVQCEPREAMAALIAQEQALMAGS